MSHTLLLRPTLVALGAVLLSIHAAQPPAHAQQAVHSEAPDTLRERLRLPLGLSARSVAPRPVYGPAITTSTPAAFGMGWGDAFVGAGLQGRGRFVKAPDGAVAAGFGLGNPRTLVGLEVVAISFSTVRSGWGRRAGIDLKLHRQLPGHTAVAIGIDNALTRGRPEGGLSRYAVISKLVPLRGDAAAPLGTLVFSAGLGDGRFRSEAQWVSGDLTPNLFGSAALQLLPTASLIADWSGQDLTLALSAVPFRGIPLVITPGFVDLTGHAGDGARFSMAVSYGLHFTPRPRVQP